MAKKSIESTERSSSEKAKSSPESYRASSQRRTRRLVKRLLLTVVVLGLAGTAGYFGLKYRQSQKEVTNLSDPKVAAAKQVSDLVAQVGKLVQLPTGETPTIATVTDLSKLKGQTFFANAKNDDKVLIYTQAKRAILYRPSENKVLEIAPLNIGNTPQPAAVDTAPPAAPDAPAPSQ